MELIAIDEGREMGRVARNKTGKLSFTYNEEWRNAPDAFPLSISMPLALTEHGNAKIDPFLWGLLPDNANVLDHWARRFHVSARNAFGLIGIVVDQVRVGRRTPVAPCHGFHEARRIHLSANVGSRWFQPP